MRNFHDFDENFKFLWRSLKDKEYKANFDNEVIKALNQFMFWYKQGNTLEEAEWKTRRSWGTIVSDVAMCRLAIILAN